MAVNRIFMYEVIPYLESSDFSKAIKYIESKLRKLPVSEYSSIINKSLLHHVDDLNEWISAFYKESKSGMEVKSLLFLMNEFDINTDLWYIEGFALKINGELDNANWMVDKCTDYDRAHMTWLFESIDNVSDNSFMKTNSRFALTGYETLQEAFENTWIFQSNTSLRSTKEWCEILIFVRFMELIREAHIKAKNTNRSWAAIPLYFTNHKDRFVLKS